MSRRFDHLADVEVFINVVEQGSLSAAAITLATTPSVISRALMRLETRLGCELLRRTTRRLSLTDAGRLYLEQSKHAFNLIDDTERAIQGQGQQISGHIRISAPTTYGHYRLPVLLRTFSQQYPQVHIDLNITNRNIDLVADGYDFAIRLGELRDSSLIARKLENARLCLVAAPDYLKQYGHPQQLTDLATHQCLPFLLPSTGRPIPWLFQQDEQAIEWVPKAQINVSDDVLAVVSLAEQSLGICQIYDFIVRERIQRGALLELLPQLAGRSRAFSLIYTSQRRMSAAARAFIDIMLTETVKKTAREQAC
ncbi:LysR family transcriptional regulator [Neisseriaceae bacterium TC5R-5]|nr:LysR family transcriptional regulator [Neisseriaceae bacterium TC5R-5]